MKELACSDIPMVCGSGVGILQWFAMRTSLAKKRAIFSPFEIRLSRTMLFVIDKPEFQRAISFARDDRTKADWGLAGPFMRLEAKDDYVKLAGLETSAKIPATVYEPGVLFLKVTAQRRLLRTIKKEKYLTIQVMSDGLLMDRICLPLEPNEMLLFTDPDQAPQVHPAVRMSSKVSKKPEPNGRQLLLWDKTDIADDDRKEQP